MSCNLNSTSLIKISFRHNYLVIYWYDISDSKIELDLIIMLDNIALCYALSKLLFSHYYYCM